MKKSSRLVFAIVLVLPVLISRIGHAQTFAADTSAADTSKANARDTLARGRVPIHLMGSIDRSLPADQVLTDSSEHFVDYRYLGDLITTAPGFSILEFGAQGQWQQLYSEGIGARGIQFLSDGAPLNDGTSGTYNLSYYPTEHLERIEFVTGTEAYVYGLNSPGGVINLVTLNKKALRPYSHIFYGESAYGQSFVDGMLSQDIIRNLNVTVGAFHATFGGRYDNSNEDHWHGRVKVRYNLSDYTNVSVSGNYTQTHIGMFGGTSSYSADTAYQPFAPIQNGNAYEKVTRHDVQLNVAQILPGDSNGVSTLTAYYSDQKREYRDEEIGFPSTGTRIHQDQPSRWYGLRLEHQRNLGANALTVGGEWRAERGNENPFVHETNIFGIAKIQLDEVFRLSPSIRFDHFGYREPSTLANLPYLSYTSLSYGSDVSARPVPWIEFFAGYSHSRYFPLTEINGISPLDLKFVLEPEVHDLVETGIELINSSENSFGIKYFHRNIQNAINLVPSASGGNTDFGFSNLGTRILQGFSVHTSERAGSFVLEGTAQYLNVDDKQYSVATLPEWSADGGFYYWDTLLTHHLNLKCGLEGKVFSSYFGYPFNDQALAYIQFEPGGIEIPGSAVLNFVILAHLGDAYVHIIIDNILDRQYVMNVFYPMVDRSLRFGVSWEFNN